MSITNDFIKDLKNNGFAIGDRRGKALGGNAHNRSLAGINKGGTHWDAVAHGTIEGHEKYWQDAHGWKSTGGYTAFVTNEGKIIVNYDFEKVTWGVGNHNTPTLNFCYAGNYANPMNDNQKRALKAMWTFVVNDKRININSFDDIWGHKEFSGHASNACPGIDMNQFRSYLKGSSSATPKPAPAPKPVNKGIQNSVAGATLVKHENAKYTVTASGGIKTRYAPDTKTPQAGLLEKGASINYDSVYSGNGYRWLSYVGNSGNRIYLPYRPLSGTNEQWGYFGSAPSKSAPKPTPKPENLSVAGAKFVKNENGRFTTNTAIKVRNQPTTKATHTGTLSKGVSIRYDKVYEGNGYRWLSYIGNSGNRLYVPYRPINNKNNQWGTFG